MTFKVSNPCRCCGAESKTKFCSRSCILIHAQNYRDAIREATKKVYTEYYG